MYREKTLPYDYQALEPYIDTRTVGIHYNNHYKGYLNKLNNLLKEQNFKYQYPLEELPKHIDEFPIDVRGDILFNIGGVLNHELYFQNMSPNKNKEPKGVLKEAIEKKYGSFENFKNEFKRNAMLLKGSGYTFLVVKNSELQIVNMPNQETPYTYNMIPIMAIDLWEHAYYLKYQNNKEEYINNFFEIVDFDVILSLYEKATK